MTEYSIVLTTTNTEDNLNKIIENLLNHKLAACLQYYPIKSAYVWDNEIQKDDEFILIIKTKESLFKEVEERIKEVHSYDEPEIISLPISSGSSGYLDWISEVTKGSKN